MDNKYFIKERKIKRIVLVVQVIIVLLFFTLWELLGKFKIINSFLFSYPSEIYEMFKLYINNGDLFNHMGISFIETITSLFVGMAIGLFIAIIIWWNKLFDKIIEPFLVVLNALPKTALAPIIIIWIGTGMKGIIAVGVSISVILTVLSASQSFKSVNDEYILMLKTFKANKLQILYKLILPANRSNLINLVKINIGMSWVGVIVGEFIVSKEGIGYLIMYGTQVFKMSLVMMGVIVLCIISYLMYEIVNLIEKIERKKNNE